MLIAVVVHHCNGNTVIARYIASSVVDAVNNVAIGGSGGGTTVTGAIVIGGSGVAAAIVVGGILTYSLKRRKQSGYFSELSVIGKIDVDLPMGSCYRIT
jgi:hypothetical protein